MRFRIAVVAGLAGLVTIVGLTRQFAATPMAMFAGGRAEESDGDRFDAPDAASAFYLRKRLPPGTAELPLEKLFEAREHMKSMAHVSSSTGLRRALEPASNDVAALSASWTPLGPGNIGGRTMAFAIDPTNTAVLYAGTAGGGVWKSIDAGANWTPISDTMANLSIASLALDPANAQVIYAGTGEGDGAGPAIRGAGVFKSIDGGAHWTRLSSTTTSSWYYVNAIGVSRLNSLRVVAANNTGIYTSPDGGTTFVRTQVATNCLHLASTLNAGVETWLASCGNFAQATVYRSTDATTWTPVLSEAGMGRTSLAISGLRAYAVATSYVDGPDRTGDGVGDYRSQLHAVFRSDDGGQTWNATLRNTDPHWGNTLILTGYYSCATLTGGLGQGWYDNTVAIDPLNPNSVWVGGIYLYRSDDGGVNWGRGPNVHPDHHVLQFDPGFNGTTNQILYDGQDGGVYRSSNARAAVGAMPAGPGVGCTASTAGASSLNHGFAATQFYHGVPYPDGTRYIAGAQDNGTDRGSDAGGSGAWSVITCGDGGYNAIDPTNTNTLYAACNGIDIRKSINGGTNFASADAGISPSEPAVFIPPFALDPNSAQRLWFGGQHAYRTIDGTTSWVLASTAFASGTTSAIAIAPGNPDLVLMGTSSGRVYRTTAASTATSTTAWTEHVVNAGGYLSSLSFAPGDASIVYASISTFGRPHVLKSIDGGQTWSNISGSGPTGLPDVPALSVVVDVGDPARLFVGTDVGVFTSADGGATWAVEITGFPNVSTEWLAMTGDATGRSLFAFTHGRGAFRAALGPGPSSNIFADSFE